MTVVASESHGDAKEPTILRIVVGSTNPAKIRAAEQSIREALHTHESSKRRPRWTSSPDSPYGEQFHLVVVGMDVESGVSDQPFGDEETCEGAKTRAKLAYLAFQKANGRAPHLAIGMEGGLEWQESKKGSSNPGRVLYCMAWMAVYGRREAVTVDLFASADTETYFGDKRPVFGLAKTASFALPLCITKLVESGMELGDADDKVFGRVKAKHGSGTVGLLTDGLVDRVRYYEHAILMALVPWIRPDLYPDGTFT